MSTKTKHHCRVAGARITNVCRSVCHRITCVSILKVSENFVFVGDLFLKWGEREFLGKIEDLLNLNLGQIILGQLKVRVVA